MSEILSKVIIFVRDEIELARDNNNQERIEAFEDVYEKIKEVLGDDE